MKSAVESRILEMIKYGEEMLHNKIYELITKLWEERKQLGQQRKKYSS